MECNVPNYLPVPNYPRSSYTVHSGNSVIKLILFFSFTATEAGYSNPAFTANSASGGGHYGGTGDSGFTYNQPTDYGNMGGTSYPSEPPPVYTPAQQGVYPGPPPSYAPQEGGYGAKYGGNNAVFPVVTLVRFLFVCLFIF
jgi:hypothetical protein